MRVLVTGAAGSIGQVVTSGMLALGHEPVGLDLLPAPDGAAFTWHAVDCSDPEAVASVFAGERFDAVVHLASQPQEGPLHTILESHVVTTAALLDAMVAHHVPRMVYASSNHAVGLTPRSERLDVDTRPRPDTFYGVGKVAAEALLSLYADRHGLDCVSCRIGSFLERPETRRHLATWLSPDDCVRMVAAALTAPDPGYAVIYGISGNTQAWWDLEPGRVLGYEPRDDAEAWADDLPARAEDDDENAVVGGPYALLEAARPAF